MLKKELGLNIKKYREALNFSQKELSELAGIERTQLSKIEQGKLNSTIDTLDKICKALSISMSQLMEIKNNPVMKPFVKWAGGKTQILDVLKKNMPSKFNKYIEPFIGGGALFFSIAPQKAIINDLNTELMCAYKCISDDKSFCLMTEKLEEFESNHSEETYYKVREMDREEGFLELPDYIRGARMIYLNKACFNGLYRVNSKGFFNVPSAKKKKVITYDRDNLLEIRNYFKTNKIELREEDYSFVISEAKAGDFVYFDPPYDTLDEKSSFTSYNKDSFGREEQSRLCECVKTLSDNGVFVMLSNHNTSFINELYKDFNITVIKAKRLINSNASGRGEVEEVIITNYKEENGNICTRKFKVN